jgi:hypothetical protein
MRVALCEFAAPRLGLNCKLASILVQICVICGRADLQNVQESHMRPEHRDPRAHAASQRRHIVRRCW